MLTSVVEEFRDDVVLSNRIVKERVLRLERGRWWSTNLSVCLSAYLGESDEENV